MISETYNEDCMVGIKRFPDKFFDLGLSDGPYFEGVGEKGFYGADFTNQGRRKGNYKPIENWNNNIPDENYYLELVRVSRHQIIWGINYFPFIGLVGPGRIIWDKKNDDSTFSNCEIASISLIDSVKIFRYLWNGMLQEDMKNKERRIHPTQKPVALYKWLLTNYAKPGDKILDTHLGSQSSRIAAYDLGFDFYGWELDKDYYEAGNKRFNQFKSQTKLDLKIA